MYDRCDLCRILKPNSHLCHNLSLAWESHSPLLQKWTLVVIRGMTLFFESAKENLVLFCCKLIVYRICQSMASYGQVIRRLCAYNEYNLVLQPNPLFCLVNNVSMFDFTLNPDTRQQ